MRDALADDYRTWGGDVAVSAMVPGVRYSLCHADDGSGEASLWLRETYPDAKEHGSWALAEYVPGHDSFEIHTYGPRNLWNEVAGAVFRWRSWGSPERSRFGATVTPDGTVTWLDDPINILGELA